MTEFGYQSQTPTQVGFVRTYIYVHPISNRKISVTTGAHADYWEDLTGGGFGYHADLKPYLAAKQ